jgi:hypothetical protein
MPVNIPRFLKTKKAKILLTVIILLIALRIALPYILLHYANKSLAEVDGYYGHVNDLNVSLLRGAYTLDSFYLNKVDAESAKQTEFMSARTVDLSLEWKALFQGKLVGELVFVQPNLRFTKNVVELKDVARDTSDFRELLEDFMPIAVNRCEIQDGNLRYIDNTRSPKVDVAIEHMHGAALNLRNVYSPDDLLPATIDVTADVYQGVMSFAMKLNPLAEQPLFDLTTIVERTNLVKLNDFFMAYGGFDVNKGEFNMYSEAAAKDGKFTGYVKPIIKGLDIVSWKGQDKEDSFFQKIWESVIGGAGELLENQRKDQVATKINFSGSIDDPKSNILEVVILVLQNAFIEALRPSIDNEINLSKLAESEDREKKGFFKSLFKSDKKDKKKD